MPKHVNQLRTLNNPKVSYESRIVSGKKIDKGGQILILLRDNHTFYKNSPNKYFTTLGENTAHKIYPKNLIKNTNEEQLYLKIELDQQMLYLVIKKILGLKLKKLLNYNLEIMVLEILQLIINGQYMVQR